MNSHAAGYRVLLRLLPRSFRSEFEDEMTQVFLEQLRRSSGAGRAGLWTETTAAIVALSLRLRIDHTQMDLRHAVRGLSRQKTFTLTAVATLPSARSNGSAPSRIWLTPRRRIATAIGIALGVAGAVAASTVLTSVLFEVAPRDPLTLAAVSALLLLVCWASSYLPARRAVSASPAEALRAD